MANWLPLWTLLTSTALWSGLHHVVQCMGYANALTPRTWGWHIYILCLLLGSCLAVARVQIAKLNVARQVAMLLLGCYKVCLLLYRRWGSSSICTKGEKIPCSGTKCFCLKLAVLFEQKHLLCIDHTLSKDPWSENDLLVCSTLASSDFFSVFY